MDAAQPLLTMPPPAMLREAPEVRADGSREEIRKAAEDFEAFFLSQMFEYMFAGIDTNGPFGGGPGEKIFRSLLLQEYGKSIASRGGIGIADDVERQLLQAQEVGR